MRLHRPLLRGVLLSRLGTDSDVLYQSPPATVAQALGTPSPRNTHHTTSRRCSLTVDALALALIGVLLLSGCTPSTSTAAPSAGINPSSSPTARGVNSSPPVDLDPSVEPVPEAATDSQTAALDAATGALIAYARPDLDYQDWIAGLYPHLSQTGATAYEDTDPAQIPVHQITGAGTILPASTDVALIVQLPTDAGIYNISLSRPNPDATWLADRIRPAGG